MGEAVAKLLKSVKHAMNQMVVIRDIVFSSIEFIDGRDMTDLLKGS